MRRCAWLLALAVESAECRAIAARGVSHQCGSKCGVFSWRNSLPSLRALRGGSLPEWTAHTTEDGQTYYYSAETGESTWDMPPGFDSPSGDWEAPAADVQLGAGEPAPFPEPAEWTQHVTEDGTPYYYNAQTEESSWDPPPGFAPSSGAAGPLVGDEAESLADGAGGGVSPREVDVGDGAGGAPAAAPSDMGAGQEQSAHGASTVEELLPAAAEGTEAGFAEEESADVVSTGVEAARATGEDAAAKFGAETAAQEVRAGVGAAAAPVEEELPEEDAGVEATGEEEQRPESGRGRRKHWFWSWLVWCCGGEDEAGGRQPGEGPVGQPRPTGGADGKLGPPMGVGAERGGAKSGRDGRATAAQVARAEAEAARAEVAELGAALAASRAREMEACEQLKQLDMRVRAEEELLVRVQQEADVSAARAEVAVAALEEAEEARARAEQARAATEQAARRVEAELESARRADAEAAAAELSRANEELSSANKELSGVNAELSSVNAELSSVNAELASVNAELAERAKEAEGLRASLVAVRQEADAAAARVAEVEAALAGAEAAAAAAAAKCAAELGAAEAALATFTARAASKAEEAEVAEAKAAEAIERAVAADRQAAVESQRAAAQEARAVAALQAEAAAAARAAAAEAAEAEAAAAAAAARAAAGEAEALARAAVADEVAALRLRASEAQAAAAAAEGAAQAARREAGAATSLREQAQDELGAALEREVGRARDADGRAVRAVSERDAARAAAAEAEAAAAETVAAAERRLHEMEIAVRSTAARCDALSELRAAADQDAAAELATARAGALRVEAGVLGVQAASLHRYAGAWINRAHRSASATAAFRHLCSLMPHVCRMVHAPGAAGPAGAGGGVGGQGMAGGGDAAGDGLPGLQAEIKAETENLTRDHLALAAGWLQLAALVQPMPSHWRLPSRAAATLARACDDQREIALALADLVQAPHARPERTPFFDPHTRSAEVAAALDAAAAELRQQLGAPHTALEWLLGAAATAGRPPPLPSPPDAPYAAAIGTPGGHQGPGEVVHAEEEKHGGEAGPGDEAMQEVEAAIEDREEAGQDGAPTVVASEEAALEQDAGLGTD